MSLLRLSILDKDIYSSNAFRNAEVILLLRTSMSENAQNVHSDAQCETYLLLDKKASNLIHTPMTCGPLDILRSVASNRLLGKSSLDDGEISD